MRILSVGNFSNPSWDGSQPDEEHIAKALEDLGHKVWRLQREEYMTNGTYFDADFALVAQWDGYEDRLEHNLPFFKNPPIVYWAFDYQADGQEWHKILVDQSDLYLSKRLEDISYGNWQWLSQDFAPWFMNAYNEKPERDIDVLFTGSYLPWAIERNETLKAIDDNFNLQINSVNSWDGFKNVQGPIMDQQYTSLVARAKINISIDHTLEAGYWSDRSAQIMACGGFVMMRYIPLAEVRFQDKVDWFYSIDDCLKKIEDNLEGYSGETKRKVMGSLGYTYAHNNLMVQHRVKDLLRIVNAYLHVR